MKLIVFYLMATVQDVGCGTNDIRVRPMFFMKWRTDIKRIIHRSRNFNIPTKLHKLLSPINSYGNGKGNKRIFPYQGMENEDLYTQREVYQCKEMPPNKFQHFLCFEPKLLPTMSHLILLPWNQNITTATKHPLSIISKDRTLSFHEWPAFEGGQIHEFS